LNQTQSFQTESLRLLNLGYLGSLGFLKNLTSYNKTSNAYLMRLSSQLNQWNIERVSKRNANGVALDLSLDDVNTLKELIRVAIEKASVRYPDVIYDQLLFLTIGAIQVQSQTGSDKAWSLLNQSIQSHLNSRNEKRIFSFGLITTAMLICLTVITFQPTKTHKADDASQILSIGVIASEADQVTMSMLLLAYNKMKSGTCQLPQAAMLPQEQREAFLKFVNKGVVEVQHVENLRLALGYVNCLYPQELMHPVVSAGNRL
jgi:uncharacterized ubiquitin-like protein YukD